jgi:hypothetical protein
VSEPTNNEEWTKESTAGLLLLLAAIAITIGVGYIFGAGFGWSVLGLFLLFYAIKIGSRKDNT